MSKKVYILFSLIIVVTAYFGFELLRSQNVDRGLEIKVAFIGDQGLTIESKKVLELIKAEGTDIVLDQGDFDYVDNPTAWQNQINDVLGPSFPYYSTIGNHDEKKWKEYQQKIVERLGKTPQVHCVGNIGVKTTCTYKNLFLLSMAPGIVRDDYGSYIQSASTTDNSWKICLWHKNQKLMQLGQKQDEAGWEVYEECRKLGAIIATAHEHSYSRTHVLDNFSTQHIATTSNTLTIAPGKTFAFVSGLGGQSIRPQVLKGTWWASTYTSTQGAASGALFCIFNVQGVSTKAHCYFKDINGTIPDSFDIVRAE
jgi:hypothetical protein